MVEANFLRGLRPYIGGPGDGLLLCQAGCARQRPAIHPGRYRESPDDRADNGWRRLPTPQVMGDIRTVNISVTTGSGGCPRTRYILNFKKYSLYIS